MKRKYHSGLIPAGAGANGSAFIPKSQGKKTAKANLDEAEYKGMDVSDARYEMNALNIFFVLISWNFITSHIISIAMTLCTSFG